MITIPTNTSLRIDGVQVIDSGGTINRQGNATIILQDGATLQ
jgi:hypothetical protein